MSGGHRRRNGSGDREQGGTRFGAVSSRGLLSTRFGGDVGGVGLVAGRAFRFYLLVLVLGIALLQGCSNDPYGPEDPDAKTLYSSFVDAPRTLDPAVAYSVNAHAVTGAVYDTLLKYHFLKRPLELMPGLAVALPTMDETADGQPRFRFELRRDLLFQDDVCFELGAPGRTTREVLAADIAFQLMRLGDPKVGSPVIEPFSSIDGFEAFGAALAERREADPPFAEKPVHEQYAEVGGIRGVRTPSSHTLEISLGKPNPQLRYWFAMEFTTPVPWEAIAYYDGQEGRPRFEDHPVGAGPFFLSQYDKQSRMVLSRNPNWYGVRHPEWQAPAATFPAPADPSDVVSGRAEYAGRALPLIDRVVFTREKESIPRFNKFLQGYYDASGVIKESFDAVIQEGGLSEEMKEMGVRLGKSVSPDVFYIGFNFDDDVVGLAGGERSRKLRQAMSLVIDSKEFLRIFLNERGAPAQSPLPPGIYGFEEDYANPYRQPDLERAKALMVEAGYANGIDPETGDALKLTFDTYNTTTSGLNQVRFFTNAWQRLGIEVEIAASNYNQFQEKLRRNAHQVFQFGWVADYPDPENFLFLLWSKMGNRVSKGPNATNFANPRFDEVFLSMKGRENGPERMAEIRELTAILERERPWIELFHREDYSLFHGWVRNVKPMGLSIPTYQYRDLDPELRNARRLDWNEPIVWPAWVLAIAAVAVVIPGIRTYWKERQ